MICASVAALTDDSKATDSEVSEARLNQRPPDFDLMTRLPSEAMTAESATSATIWLTGNDATWCRDGNAQKSKARPEVSKYKQSSPATSQMLAARTRLLNFTVRALGCSRSSCRRNRLQLVDWTATRKLSQRCSSSTSQRLLKKTWFGFDSVKLLLFWMINDRIMLKWNSSSFHLLLT